MTLRARVEASMLLITVDDDGLGLQSRAARPGNGMALENLRARLASRFGDQASMELTPQPDGTRATLRLPLTTGGTA